jgi:hypothetical protein
MSKKTICKKSVTFLLLLNKERFGKPCPVNEQDLFYIMLPYVHVLVMTTDSWGYFNSTVWGEYVTKATSEPPAVLDFSQTGVLINQTAGWFQCGSCQINQTAAWFFFGGCLIDQATAWFWSGSRLIDQAPAGLQAGGCLINQAVSNFQIFRFPTIKLVVIQ